MEERSVWKNIDGGKDSGQLDPLGFLAKWHKEHTKRKGKKVANENTPVQVQSSLVKFELPKTVDAGIPVHTVKGEALLNSVIVLRGVGGVINASLGPCRPVFFQFAADFEEVGPIQGAWVKEAGEWIATFPDDDDRGIYQFLLSETSPALRVAKSLMGEYVQTQGHAARIATLRSRRSGTNVGFSFYVLDKPIDGDLYADRSEVWEASMP